MKEKKLHRYYRGTKKSWEIRNSYCVPRNWTTRRKKEIPRNIQLGARLNQEESDNLNRLISSGEIAKVKTKRKKKKHISQLTQVQIHIALQGNSNNHIKNLYISAT